MSRTIVVFASWIPFIAALAYSSYVWWLNVGVSASSWVEMQAFVFAQSLCLAGIGVGLAGTSIVRAWGNK